MAKIRIYELAKEISEKIGGDSKNLGSEIISILSKKGTEVKSVSSGVEQEEADFIRKHFDSGKSVNSQEKKKKPRKNERKKKEKPHSGRKRKQK